MNFLTMLKDFQSMGCTDQSKCAVACRVYMDLMEDKRYTDIEKIFDENLNIIYLKTQFSTNGLVTILPTLDCQEVDFQLIEQLQSKNENKSLTLAICDTSSNILYYKLSNGFVDKT
uniref:tRNA-splicing endonuclease subunit Sen15 domain-containing protein n=1 Tax=Glossina palpalis gambiensis TaxID=67801 RepID=A0A1B0AZI9_9MUSC